MITTNAPDLLLVILVMFAGGTAASHLLFRKSPMARAIARVSFLILLTIALLYVGIVPYQPLQSTGVPWHDAAQAVLKIAWWLWMAWFLVGFLRAFVVVERRPRGIDGRVIEMNWRATHVLTARRDLAIVPNSTIAKSKIVNVSSPSGVHGSAVTLQIGSTTSPSLATDILERAILNCRRINAEPPPVILIKSINGAYIEFEITFFIETLSELRHAQNELLDLIYRHLIAAGIGLAVPEAVAMERDPRKERTQAETVLGLVEIFSTLTTAERAMIAASLKPRSFDRGETLLEPGAVSRSLFIVGSGVLSLTRHDIVDDKEILRLGPGDHYGEIGLMTGNPSTAIITALTPVTLYELAKDDLARILEGRPEVARELGCAIARRQAAGRSTAEETQLDGSVPSHRLTSWFTAQIQRLYDIDSAA